jgi:hypothetical protein
MADLKQQPDEAWERFFEFLFPCERDCEEKLPREEVQADLRRLGIDVGKAVSRVQQAVAAAKGKAELATARARRIEVMGQIGQVVVPSEMNLRTRLKDIISGKFAGTEQALYFRKLESAATEEDLQSLLEDIHRLDKLSEGQDGGDPSAK